LHTVARHVLSSMSARVSTSRTAFAPSRQRLVTCVRITEALSLLQQVIAQFQAGEIVAQFCIDGNDGIAQRFVIDAPNLDGRIRVDKKVVLCDEYESGHHAAICQFGQYIPDSFDMGLPNRIDFMLNVRISAMVISRFGERDQSGRWCCAVNGL
jgi:hypothetical protein